MSDVFESPLRELKEFEDLDRDLNRKKGLFWSAAVWIPRRSI